MAVDPYVPVELDDVPRCDLPVPPAGGWRADRPGELPPGPTQPSGRLLGSPGPDGGYALTLAARFADRITVVAPETVHDAEAVAAAVAMRRASIFGRAPVMTDLEVAFALFGWLADGAPSDDLVEWRRRAAAGCGHAYTRCRALVDAVPADVLRRTPGEARAGLVP